MIVASSHVPTSQVPGTRDVRRGTREGTILPGQTIIEMLVVLFVISVALYGVTSLIFSNLALQESDADNIQAMNLAREMLELAQNQRDSDWLAVQPFGSGMINLVGGCSVVPRWNGTADPAFAYVSDINQASAVVKRSSVAGMTNMFTNVSGTSTQFSRLLTFIPICANADHSIITYPSGSCGCAVAPQTELIGLRAKADVRWTRKGSVKNLTIYTDLYDWR